MNGALVSPATRQRVRNIATPIARGLGRLGLTPNALTVIGFLGACVAAGTAALEAWLATGLLVLGFGIFDLFDGTLARATGRVSRFGAFLDSTLDRAGEAVVYLGVGAGLLAAESQLGAVLAASAMAAAFMVSYTRAKAESLGYSPGSGMMNVGFAPREVRIVLLVIGLIVAGLGPGFSLDASVGPANLFVVIASHEVLELTLGLITILATLTAIQRIRDVRAQSKEG